MTEITWEQAREKVRERWPDAYVRHDAEGICIAVWCGPFIKRLSASVNVEGFADVDLWLEAYARMTETTVVPPSFADQMHHAIDHGNVSARMEALEAQLAAANEQIARLAGAVPCINPIEKPTRCSIGEFGNIVRVPDGEFYLASEAEGHMQIIERQLQTATEALAAERGLRELWENVARLALPRAETLQSDNTRLRDALTNLDAYDFVPGDVCGYNCGSKMEPTVDGEYVLMSDLCAALAAVEGKGGL